MLKVTVVVFAILSIVVHALHPTAEEAKSEMIAAGISESAVNGLIAIADKYKTKFEQAKSDREAGQAAFDSFHKEADTYIKTQSEADQTAYKAFIEKKKAAIEAQKSAKH